MEILSYALSTCATVLGIFEPFGKKMKTILMFSLAGNFLVAMSYLAVHAYSGFLICSVACVQLIINYTFDKKHAKLPSWLIAVYIVSFAAVNLLSFSRLYDLLALAASVLFVLSVSQTNAKYYRLYYVANCTLWIIYDILSKAYGNLSTHIILSCVLVVAITVRDKKNKTA